MSYLREASLDKTNFPLFTDVKGAIGFIPSFIAQTTLPDLIEAVG